MKYAVVFSRETGNTQLLADKVKNSLPQDEIVYFGLPNDKALDAERLYIGFWTDEGTCDKQTAEFLQALHQKEIFLFGSAGFGMDKTYFQKVLEKAEQNLNVDCTLVGEFMCQGKMKPSVLERYEKMKKSATPIPNIDLLIENYHMALSHPDNVDLQNLQEVVKSTV